VDFPNFHMICPYPDDLYLLMLTSWYRAGGIGVVGTTDGCTGFWVIKQTYCWGSWGRWSISTTQD